MSTDTDWKVSVDMTVTYCPLHVALCYHSACEFLSTCVPLFSFGSGPWLFFLHLAGNNSAGGSSVSSVASSAFRRDQFLPSSTESSICFKPSRCLLSVNGSSRPCNPRIQRMVIAFSSLLEGWCSNCIWNSLVYYCLAQHSEWRCLCCLSFFASDEKLQTFMSI